MPHTPGPWSVFRGYDGAETVAIMRTRKASLSVNAAKQWITDDSGRVKSDVELDVESELNANIMAASPDLLAACRLMLRVLEVNNLDPVDADCWSIRERAEQAIAKAEGRS